MRQIFLILAFSCAAFAARADVMDEISAAVFDKGSIPLHIKPELRKCRNDKDCTTVMLMCRWRESNQQSKALIEEQAKKYTPACIWPPPPPEPPAIFCTQGLCTIPPDGKHY